MPRSLPARCLIALVPLGLAALPALAESPTETCAAEFVDIRTDDGEVRFAAEVVDTYETRAQGLMFREDMATDHGMFFVYDRAEPVVFWMRDTPLPLDIIFINRRGVICAIARDTTPFSDDHIPSRCAAQTVLEVNAGQAAAQGVRIGAAVRHPAINAPVWPCDAPG